MMESLTTKRKGCHFFSECSVINKILNNLEGLIDSEYEGYVKMVRDVSPFKATYNRSEDGI